MQWATPRQARCRSTDLLPEAGGWAEWAADSPGRDGAAGSQGGSVTDSEENPVAIRRATLADAAVLAGLGTATFVETFGRLYTPADLSAFLTRSRTIEAYREFLEDPRAAAWLALLDDGQAVGYVTAGPCKLPVPGLEADAGEVQQLYVLARHQQRRLGTRLFTTALDWLNERGHAPLYVGVWSENHGAQRLYERFGFEKIGEYDFPVGEHLDREFILKRVAA